MKKYYHYGNGPGEYINLGDFDISRDGNFIFILDYTKYKLCKYSIENKLIKEVKLEFSTSSFSCIDDNLLVFYQGNRFNPDKELYNNDIVYLDFDKNKPVRGYFPAKDRRMMIGSYAIYSSGEQLFYCPYSTTGVYKINKDGVTPFINFSGVNQIEEEIWKITNGKEFIYKIIESDYHIDFRDFYVIEDLISFAFTQQNYQYKIFYSMKSDKMIAGSGFPFNDPNRFPGNFNIIGTYKDDFVSYFSPLHMMKKSYEIFPFYKNHPELHHDLIELSKKTAINDNPVIVFFQITIE